MNSDIEPFLSDLTLSGRKKRTVNNYRYTLGMFFRFCNKQRASEVSVDDVRSFLGFHQRRWCGSTYFMVVARLKAFFKTRNQTVYEYLKGLKVRLEKPEIKPLTRDEILAIAREMGRYRGGGHAEKTYYTIALFLPATGARIGEACSLNMGDVSVENDLIRIHFRAEITKTGVARDVWIRWDSLAGRALMDYIKWRYPYKPEDPLFVNSQGRRLQPQRVDVKYQQACRALGLKKRVTPHVNRHTFASFLIENDVDPKTVAELTGHRDAKVLFDVYSHISQKRKKQVLSRLQIV